MIPPFWNSLLAASSVVLLCAAPAAAIPTVFPVQGSLSTSDGVPLDGDVNARLTLYESPTSNSLVFTEAVVLDVDEGAFFHYLGSVSTLDASLIEGADDLYLEIEIAGEALSPRLEIGAVPYATLAGRCEVADAVFIGETEVTGVGLQRRIAIPCGPTQAIRSVGLDGIPACVDVGGGSAGPGDISAVAAGQGLTGGGTSGDVDLAVDFDVAQRRITAACPSNQFAVSVTATGTLVCAAPPASGGTGDITGVASGEGLVGGATSGEATLTVDFTVAQRRITAACPSDQFAVAVSAAGALVCASPPAGGAGDIESVTAGVGLLGGGTSGAVTLSLAPMSCPLGQFQTGIDAAGDPLCQVETGDITDVVAGTGLTGGALAGSASLAVNDAVFQRRVGTCSTGQLITAVATDGAVTCVDFPQGRVQRKALASGVNADGAIASLSFSNLVVGKAYRLSAQIALEGDAALAADAPASVVATHGAATVARTIVDVQPSKTVVTNGLAATFVATATTLNLAVTGLAADVTLLGDGTGAETTATLEELANTVVTTDF